MDGRKSVGVNTEQITAADIIDWNSLGDIVASFEKRGLEPRPSMGAQNERLLGIGNDEYIVIIEAKPDESADDYQPESTSRHTHIVASEGYDRFTFVSRIRSWEEQKRGNVKYQQMSFEKDALRQGLENEAEVLRNINAIQYQSSTPPFERVRQGSKRALTYVRNLI